MKNANFRPHPIAAALVMALCVPASIVLAAENEDKEQEQKAERIEVTGSRIKRSEIESATPVQILTSEQIKQEGFLTVYDVLSTLNEAIGTVEADLQWGTHTPNASPLNLRNMGPGRTLLLVNGRRVADYPMPYGGQSNFSNYSNIPAAAVERVEVLTGSASAIYGSDAVAGVINVIMKKNYSGDEVRFRAGTSTEGGRDTRDLSWAGGKEGEKWSVTYALQYTKRDPLFGRDRPEMDDASDAPYSSWNVAQRRVGMNPLTALYGADIGLYLRDMTAGQFIAPPAGACSDFGGEYYLATARNYDRNSDTISNQGTLCGKTRDYGDWLLMGGSEDYAAYVYSTFDFDEDTRAWVNFSAYDSYAIWSTSPPSAGTKANTTGRWYDADMDRVVRGVRRFTPDEVGGLDDMRNFNDELSWGLSFGLQGKMMDGRFDWEASIGRTRYTIEEHIQSIYPELFDQFFLGPQLGTQNGYAIHQMDVDRWWNPITPSQFKEFSNRMVNRAYSSMNQAAFNVSGDLFENWAGPVAFAAVVEFAEQSYNLNPDPDVQEVFGTQNDDHGGGERRRYSLGAEFQIPLHDTLRATAALRYDNYGHYEAYDTDEALNIGSQSETTYNLGLEWRPQESVLLRATYATSFRAPDMHYLLAQPSSFSSQNVDPYNCIVSGDYLTNNCGNTSEHYYAIEVNRRGTPDLESEIGESLTLGMVWDVSDDFSATLDYWSITLEDEIRDIDHGRILTDEAGCRTGLTTDPNVPWVNPGGGEYCDTVVSRVHRDGNGRITSVERGPINIAQKEVAGFDSSLRYKWDGGAWGAFNFRLNYTNLQSWKEQTYRTDPNPERRNREIRSKTRASINWALSDWTANVFVDRIGSVPGVRFHWDPARGVSGGCEPFEDGHVPSDDPAYNCEDRDPQSPTFGQHTRRYKGRVGPAITWNFNVGYSFTDNDKVTAYVNNAFNSTGWNHKDPYKLDYEFYNSRIFNPVGREVALEYVHQFK